MERYIGRATPLVRREFEFEEEATARSGGMKGSARSFRSVICLRRWADLCLRRVAQRRRGWFWVDGRVCVSRGYESERKRTSKKDEPL